MKNFLLGILALMSLVSCGIHQPMSEMLMFREKITLEDSVYYPKFSSSLSINALEQNNEIVREALGQEYDVQIGENQLYGMGSWAWNFTFLTELPLFAANLAISPLSSGIDATIRLPFHTYFTYAVSLNEGPQNLIILQKRFSNGNPSGFALGVTFRNNIFYTKQEEYYLSDDFWRSPQIQSTSVGIRAVIMLTSQPPAGSSRFFLLGTASQNYDLLLETTMFRFGVSMGFY